MSFCENRMLAQGKPHASPRYATSRERAEWLGANGCFAALDLGTNNCRLMVAVRSGDGFRVVDSFNRTVRLGEGLQSAGVLSDDAMARTMSALHVCAARLRQWPVRAICCVATEACRRAANGRAFLQRVRAETGLDIAIISPREEAELAMDSCGALLHANNHRRERGILFDIGGGSTEIAWLRLDRARRAQTLTGTTSIPWGVITMAERFAAPAADASDEEHAAYYEAMVRHVMTELDGFEAVHHIRREIGRSNVGMLGTSGTVTTLAGIALNLPRYNRHAIDGIVLTDAAALGAIDTLRAFRADGLATHPCVGSERNHYVLPGCAIFEAIHRLWPVEAVTVADRGLRDGLLFRMAREMETIGHVRSPSNVARRTPPSSKHGVYGANSAIWGA
ncbi:hypothetical protein NCH01_05410 [Neoasaia chiangmaiensis]|uniref:Ppx/GppA phosphatase family protein n=1 Tax=Neoasaia chiangmaiensis TaxID=320497 RepID=UPI001197F536|nr:Ppx/GppA phosphatase family protein [Neoasaia chiangmaiensis]GEN14110.1 hypothetical protein NCH01_05410 [Neoasaia chiangmaiensis]